MASCFQFVRVNQRKPTFFSERDIFALCLLTALVVLFLLSYEQDFNTNGIQRLTLGLTRESNSDYGGNLPPNPSDTNRVYQNLDAIKDETVEIANFICTYRPPR